MRIVSLVMVLVLAGAGSAAAQTESDDAPVVDAPSAPALDTANAPAPAPAPVATHPDEGLMIAGGVMMGISYVGGSVLSFLFSGSGLAFVPLAHWAAGFGGSQAAGLAFLIGGGFSVIEAIGLVIFLAGTLHHHPVSATAEMRPTPGDFALRF